MEIDAQIMLADIRMDGVRFDIARPRAPFCASTKTGAISYCYLLRKGRLWLEVDGAAPALIELNAGDIAGMTGSIPHRFKSAPDLKGVKETPLELVGFDKPAPEGTEVELIVGHIDAEALAFSGLFMETMVVSKKNAAKLNRRIWKAAEVVEDELSDPEPLGGSELIVRRQAEIMLLNIVRWALTEATTSDAGGLRGMLDMRILRAMAAFAQAPMKPWTVKQLADIAGMSRTAFSERYHVLVGKSPLQSVTQLRLRHAAAALMRSRQSVDEIAAASGYGSSAAFIRAFQREFHMTPARWRSTRGNSTLG